MDIICGFDCTVVEMLNIIVFFLIENVQSLTNIIHYTYII